MSRNFELMQRAGAEIEALQVGIPVTQEWASEPHENVRRYGSSQDADGIARDELFKLVQRIFGGTSPNRYRAVVFADVDLKQGSARLCAEAARMLARSTSGNVCLVDANRHSFLLPRILRTKNRDGLTDAICQEGPIRKFTQKLNPDNLRFLSYGSSGRDSGNALTSDGLKTRIEELLNEFDYLLFNAPSVNLDETATLLGPLVDGVILVVEANSTHRKVARKAKEHLTSANVRLLGAVFNNRTFPIPAAVYSKL